MEEKSRVNTLTVTNRKLLNGPKIVLSRLYGMWDFKFIM